MGEEVARKDGDRRRKENLRQFFQRSVKPFDALQAEQSNLLHGARSVVGVEVEEFRSVSEFSSTESTDHAEKEVMVWGRRKHGQQQLVETKM